MELDVTADFIRTSTESRPNMVLINKHTKLRTGYEGQKIYVLQSSTDEVVGNVACGKKASEIAGAHNIVTVGMQTNILQSNLLANRSDAYSNVFSDNRSTTI